MKSVLLEVLPPAYYNGMQRVFNPNEFGNPDNFLAYAFADVFDFPLVPCGNFQTDINRRHREQEDLTKHAIRVTTFSHA